jgi:hypothetical protein
LSVVSSLRILFCGAHIANADAKLGPHAFAMRGATLPCQM